MTAPRAAPIPDALAAPALALVAGLCVGWDRGPGDGVAAGLAAGGAYVLARLLDRGVGTAGLAGLAFALSGALAGAGGAFTAAALLPWELAALELAAGGGSWLALALAGSGGAALLLAGPPEGAAVASLAALAWAAFRSRERGRDRAIAPLLAGWLLAVLVRGLPVLPERRAGGALDLIALGGIAALADGIQLGWGSAGAGRRAASMGVAEGLAFAALVIWLAGRGLDPRASELVLPGLGPPSPLPGPALPAPAFALALVGLFGGARSIRGGGALAAGAGLASLLALRAPGVAELWNALPGLGRTPPSAWGGPAMLFAALLAGAGLEERRPRARWAAAAALVGLGLASAARALAPELPAVRPELDPPDELVDYRVEARGERPPEPGALLVTGSVHPGLPARELRLRIERLDALGPDARESLVLRAPLAAAGSEARPRTFGFATPERGAALGPGTWLVTLELATAPDAEGGELLGARRVALLAGTPSTHAWIVALGCAIAALALVASPRARSGPIALALTLAAGLAPR